MVDFTSWAAGDLLGGGMPGRGEGVGGGGGSREATAAQ